jgi:hypothetical protein
VGFTERNTNKKENTTWSSSFAQKTLEQKLKKQAGPVFFLHPNEETNHTAGLVLHRRGACHLRWGKRETPALIR